MFSVRKRNVSLRRFFYAHKTYIFFIETKNLIIIGFGEYVFYVYLPIDRTTDKLK